MSDFGHLFLTGAGGGIGSEVARFWLEHGGTVTLFGRTEAKLQNVAQYAPDRCLVCVGDARDPESLQTAVNATISTFHRIDALAHCVGSIKLKPLHAATLDDFNDVIDTNLRSAFLAIKSVLPQMRSQQSGSIVLVSTVAASQGLNNHELISAAKAGLEGIVRSGAISYARMGIRFNAVAPALTDTPLAAPLLSNEASRNISEQIHPLGRVAKPEEVARLICLLAGPESAFVTGQIWGIDGGLGAGVMPPRISLKPA
jgi:NAD(P)-dependent dehydrogenase (short-subunit alcohol dehydrogenase family)